MTNYLTSTISEAYTRTKEQAELAMRHAGANEGITRALQLITLTEMREQLHNPRLEDICFLNRLDLLLRENIRLGEAWEDRKHGNSSNNTPNPTAER